MRKLYLCTIKPCLAENVEKIIWNIRTYCLILQHETDFYNVIVVLWYITYICRADDDDHQ